jgi:hypothetical protein
VIWCAKSNCGVGPCQPTFSSTIAAAIPLRPREGCVISSFGSSERTTSSWTLIISLRVSIFPSICERNWRNALMLALIGPLWLKVASNSGMPRIEDPADYVRIELAAALRSSLKLVLVLVDGASMPGEAELHCLYSHCPSSMRSNCETHSSAETPHAWWKSSARQSAIVPAVRSN